MPGGSVSLCLICSAYFAHRVAVGAECIQYTAVDQGSVSLLNRFVLAPSTYSLHIVDRAQFTQHTSIQISCDHPLWMNQFDFVFDDITNLAVV